MSKILVIAEHLHSKLNSSTARAVSSAIAVKGQAIDVLVLSDAPDAIAAETARIEGVSKVLTVAKPENAHPLAAVLAPQIGRDQNIALRQDITGPLGAKQGHVLCNARHSGPAQKIIEQGAGPGEASAA